MSVDDKVHSVKHDGTYVSRSRLRDRKGSVSSLQTIATFRQRRLSTCKYSESTQRQLRSGQRRRAYRREFYCTWPNCPRALNRIPFTHRCRLKCHMRGHTNEKSYKCSHCDNAFTTASNLKRHLTVHQASKPYKCEVCSREFARSSERSRCRKHHQLKEELNTIENNALNIVQSGSDESLKRGAVPTIPASNQRSMDCPSLVAQCLNPNRIQCKPYKCPVCRKTRAYVDPGSLRKHMRLYHPDYKKKNVDTKTGKSSSSVKEQIAAVSYPNQPNATTTVTLAEPLLIQVVTTEAITNVMPNPDVSIVNLPCYCTEPQIVSPVWIGGPQDSSLNLTDELSRGVGIAIPDTATTNNPLPLPLLTSERSLFLVGEPQPSTQLYHNHVATQMTASNPIVPNVSLQFNEENVEGEIDDDEAHYWNSPVDLCNSAMCLQAISDKITDFPMYTLSMEKSPQPESDSADLVAFLNDSSLIDQTVALDLTEPPPYEVIDLSGDATFALTPLNPIDLSAPNPSKKDRSSMGYQPSVNISLFGTALRSNNSLVSWDPEPGFSFTDLLTNNDLDDSDPVFKNLLSNDLFVHPSPCKGSNSSSSCPVPAVASTIAASCTTVIHTQPPPLDLRLSHASLSPL